IRPPHAHTYFTSEPRRCPSRPGGGRARARKYGRWRCPSSAACKAYATIEENQPIEPGEVRMGTVWIVAVAAGLQTAGGAQAPSAASAFEECRVLTQMDVYNRAIERCEEAVRLDPTSPDPHAMLAGAYESLARQGTGTTSREASLGYLRKATDHC